MRRVLTVSTVKQEKLTKNYLHCALQYNIPVAGPGPKTTNRHLILFLSQLCWSVGQALVSNWCNDDKTTNNLCVKIGCVFSLFTMTRHSFQFHSALEAKAEV